MAYIKNKELFAGTTACMSALACLWATTMKNNGRRAKKVLIQELLDKKHMLEGPESIIPEKAKELPVTYNVLTQTPCCPCPKKLPVDNKKGNCQQPKKQASINTQLNDKFMVYPFGNYFVLSPITKDKCQKQAEQPKLPKQPNMQKPTKLPSKIPVPCVCSKTRQLNIKSSQPIQKSFQKYLHESHAPMKRVPPPTSCVSKTVEQKIKPTQPCQNKCSLNCKAKPNQNAPQPKESPQKMCPTRNKCQQQCQDLLNQLLPHSRSPKPKVYPPQSCARECQAQPKLKSPQHKCDLCMANHLDQQWSAICA